MLPVMAGYDITKIPGIMRRKGWVKGAALMEEWFSRPANDDASRGTPDTTTITMDWALGFERARRVYDEMVQDRVWANEKAQREIAKTFRLTGQAVCFGVSIDDVPRLDRSYVQFRAVGSALDPADDMKAALGRFTFRVVVSGDVTPKKGGGYRVNLEAIGIYVQDSYDFNGFQPLGAWSDSDFAGDVALPFTGATEVYNASFREYRAAHNKGGDFLVYSDVRWLRGGSKDAFDLP
jgi:hypothetical protein